MPFFVCFAVVEPQDSLFIWEPDSCFERDLIHFCPCPFITRFRSGFGGACVFQGQKYSKIHQRIHSEDQISIFLISLHVVENWFLLWIKDRFNLTWLGRKILKRQGSENLYIYIYIYINVRAAVAPTCNNTRDFGHETFPMETADYFASNDIRFIVLIYFIVMTVIPLYSGHPI